jgi:hypothetical protein
MRSSRLRRPTRVATVTVLSAVVAATSATSSLAVSPASPSNSSGRTTSTSQVSNDPRGTLSVSLHGHRVRVSGTAVDPNSSGADTVVVSVSGRRRATLHADRSGHGFTASFAIRYGRHTVSARAVNVGRGADTMLGSDVVHRFNPARRNPRGIAHIARHRRVLRIAGDAYDPDSRDHSLVVRTFRDGHRLRTVHTNGRTHRFAVRVLLPYGRSHVSVIAYNIGMGTHNPKIRRYAITIGRPWVSRYHGRRRLAAEMIGRYGWGRAQMPDLDRLWGRESGWSTTAANASGAYGIPQALPGSKMASSGPDWRHNARTQIAWGLSYINGRYGSPRAAWAHSCAYGWY